MATKSSDYLFFLLKQGWQPEVNNASKQWKLELFLNSPMKVVYNAVASDLTKWTKFIAQIISFATTPINLGDTNIAKITTLVSIISGDNDGVNKIELMKSSKLLNGDVSADLSPMPKSHLVIVPR